MKTFREYVDGLNESKKDDDVLYFVKHSISRNKSTKIDCGENIIWAVEKNKFVKKIDSYFKDLAYLYRSLFNGTQIFNMDPKKFTNDEFEVYILNGVDKAMTKSIDKVLSDKTQKKIYDYFTNEENLLRYLSKVSGHTFKSMKCNGKEYIVEIAKQ